MKSFLKVGDLVEVRNRQEILATLDEHGQLENLPFMPQMFRYCGQRFRVAARAHKTCDTVFPVRGRRVRDAVHLELRCDGEAYGGCQAGCLIFWKDAWLKKVGAEEPTTPAPIATNGCTEADVWEGTKMLGSHDSKEMAYRCQATQLPYFTTGLDWWDVRQYIEDYTSGNASLRRLANGLIYSTYYQLAISSIVAGRLLRWLYDTFHPLWNGTPYPRKTGTIPVGESTPTETLDLKPGELVRVKSHAEILRTLNRESKNRGLYFDAEMVPYCGGTYRVQRRVSQIINEKTGTVMKMKTPAIILEGVYCRSRYS